MKQRIEPTILSFRRSVMRRRWKYAARVVVKIASVAASVAPFILAAGIYLQQTRKKHK